MALLYKRQLNYEYEIIAMNKSFVSLSSGIIRHSVNEFRSREPTIHKYFAYRGERNYHIGVHPC